MAPSDSGHDRPGDVADPAHHERPYAVDRRASDLALEEPLPHSPQQGLIDYVFLASRILIVTVLVALSAFGMLRVSQSTPSVLVAGLAIMVAGAVFGTVALLLLGMSSKRILRILLFPDLVSAGLLIAATGAFQDPLYPWMIGLAMIYGAGLVASESTFFAVLVAIA